MNGCLKGSSPALLLHCKSELIPTSVKVVTRGKQNRLSSLLFNVETGNQKSVLRQVRKIIRKELHMYPLYCKIIQKILYFPKLICQYSLPFYSFFLFFLKLFLFLCRRPCITVIEISDLNKCELLVIYIFFQGKPTKLLKLNFFIVSFFIKSFLVGSHADFRFLMSEISVLFVGLCTIWVLRWLDRRDSFLGQESQISFSSFPCFLLFCMQQILSYGLGTAIEEVFC